MARRIKEDPEVHKERIANQAQKLFSKKGIVGTTMDEIAAAAGYSKATLYVYFENKNEIVQYLALKSMRRLREAIVNAVDQAAATKEQFMAICHALVEYQKQYPEYFHMSLQYLSYNDGDDVYRTGEDIIQTIIDLLRSQGIEFRVADVLHMWAMIAGLISLADQKRQYIEDSVSIRIDDFLNEGFEKIYTLTGL